MNHRNPKLWSVDGTEVIAKTAAEARRKADKPQAFVTKVIGLVGQKKLSEAVSEPPDVPTSGQAAIKEKPAKPKKKKSNEKASLFQPMGMQDMHTSPSFLDNVYKGR